MKNTIVVRAMRTVVVTLLAISALGIPMVIQMFNIEWDLSQTRRHSL